MSPSHAVKAGKRYRYYVSQAVVQQRLHEAGSLARLPALEIEQVVVSELQALLTSPQRRQRMLGTPLASPSSNSAHRVRPRARRAASGQSALLRQLVARVTVGTEQVVFRCARSALLAALGREASLQPSSEEAGAPAAGAVIDLTVSIRLQRCRGETKLVLNESEGVAMAPPPPALVKAITRAYTWNNRLLHHEVPSIRALAREAKVGERYIRRLLPLAYLAPDIMEAILEGRAPADLTVGRLIAGIPHDWTAQRRRFGFPG